MAKIFLVISILVTALTAALGFLTKSKVDNIKSARDSANNAKVAAEAQVTKTNATLKSTKDELVAANKNLDDAKSKATALEGELTIAKSDADKAKADVKAREDRIAKLEEDVKNGSTPTTTNPNPDETNRTELITAELNKLKAELEESKKVQATLTNREKQSAEALADAQRQIKQYQEPIERAGTTGRVVAVNPGWNFVVVDVGDRRGATINAPLLVMRGGQMVGRLKITSVEPATSIADIIPGSVTRGQSVQPGDRIVFAGRQSAPKEAAAGTAPAGADAAKKPDAAATLPKP
jgi:hypothetical protein